MLYNVLPPLVFFASMGGTIYVVSRVMARLHRQNLTAAVRATSTRDFAALLRPSQKSVHVIKNRLVVFSRLFRQSLFQIKEKTFSFRGRLPKKPWMTQTSKQNIDQPEPSVAKLTLRVVEKRAVPKKTAADPAITPSATIRKAKDTSLDRARRQLGACRYQSVEKTLVPFLARHPKNTRAYMLLGKAALGRHNWGEASEVFSQVVNLEPNTKGCYAALGYANYKAGKLTKALEALKKAHDADPHNIVIIKRLLSIARRMDNLPLQHSLTTQLVDLETSAKQ